MLIDRKAKILQMLYIHKLIYINIIYNNTMFLIHTYIIYMYLIQTIEVDKGYNLINITQKVLFTEEI